MDFPWLAEWLSKEKRTVEITNPSMDEKLDSRQLDSSEQQVCVGFDVTKSGYKAVIGDMICGYMSLTDEKCDGDTREKMWNQACNNLRRSPTTFWPPET